MSDRDSFYSLDSYITGTGAWASFGPAGSASDEDDDE